MFRYLRFDSCVVTCGTCREALKEIGCDEVFDCSLQDVNQFIFGTELSGQIKTDQTQYFYHPPCHDSLDGKGVELLRNLFDAEVHSIPHCCSEAGTLSLSRPDISYSMLLKKSEAIREVVSRRESGIGEENFVVTNCPSCLQGLGRQREFNLTIRHLTTEMALRTGGADWEELLRHLVRNSEVVTF